jgi:hypothetical protein
MRRKLLRLILSLTNSKKTAQQLPFFLAFTRKVLLRAVLAQRAQRFRKGAQRDFDYLFFLSILLERTPERRVKSTSFIMENSIAKTLKASQMYGHKGILIICSYS